MNPDGVIHGNYRTSLGGCDLNRRWKKPNQKLNPTVFFVKESITKFSREKDVRFIIDLHGHSKNFNAFFYGCNNVEDQIPSRVFPYLLSKINKMVSFRNSRFHYSKLQESTARVALWKELKISNVYTLEASFYGY